MTSPSGETKLPDRPELNRTDDFWTCSSQASVGSNWKLALSCSRGGLLNNHMPSAAEVVGVVISSPNRAAPAARPVERRIIGILRGSVPAPVRCAGRRHDSRHKPKSLPERATRPLRVSRPPGDGVNSRVGEPRHQPAPPLPSPTHARPTGVRPVFRQLAPAVPGTRLHPVVPLTRPVPHLLH